ncbi:phytanoyl-CoA dioxygenase domain-containing protein 1 isoform X2 [Bicyclus anynana]|uniref:Phytanoyl-CoA dioxygenase domain-containing protein 1 isoform X2 n=1 Tax=Bicyclus anynana TaxID=110368 RepID=A0ABM3M4V5_BICAN|nr:phytanoyl-CoA dioxygenase domain-containing protein 1 isoform X2 [Bicyclus anynana]
MPSTIRSQLEQDGYVVLEDFLRPAECDELAAAGRELAQQAAHAADKSVFSTLEGEKQVGHALHLLHPIFRCYTFSDRVKAVCRELDLVEPSVVQSMYIYKNPGLGGEVIAHQDASYLYTEPIPPVGLWIALEDATVQNGCLWMAAGSHKSGVHRRLIRNPDKDAKQALVYDRAAPVYPQSAFSAVPVTKGTCVVIHGHVVHKSAHNKSDKSRHAYTFHVVERHNNSYSADNWLQEGRGAPFVNLYTTPQME